MEALSNLPAVDVILAVMIAVFFLNYIGTLRVLKRKLKHWNPKLEEKAQDLLFKGIIHDLTREEKRLSGELFFQRAVLGRGLMGLILFFAMCIGVIIFADPILAREVSYSPILPFIALIVVMLCVNSLTETGKVKVWIYPAIWVAALSWALYSKYNIYPVITSIGAITSLMLAHLSYVERQIKIKWQQHETAS